MSFLTAERAIRSLSKYFWSLGTFVLSKVARDVLDGPGVLKLKDLQGKLQRTDSAKTAEIQSCQQNLEDNFEMAFNIEAS